MKSPRSPLKYKVNDYVWTPARDLTRIAKIGVKGYFVVWCNVKFEAWYGVEYIENTKHYRTCWKPATEEEILIYKLTGEVPK